MSFVISNLNLFNKLIIKKNLLVVEKIVLILIFSIIGIIGTYTGVKVNGAIANARVIGICIGGLIGGPIVGVLSGIFAGIHRYILDINGFSTLACTVSTIVQGVFSGYMSNNFKKTNKKILFAFLLGIFIEVLQMIIIILLAKPYSEALNLVRIIGIPMIITNSLGIAAVVFVLERFFEKFEKELAYQTQLALKKANCSLKYFRNGLNKKAAEKLVYMLKKDLKLDAVALTDKEKVLAYVGICEDHSCYNDKLSKTIKNKVIKKGKYLILNKSNYIACNKTCKLKSVIIVPLFEKNNGIGSLMLYKHEENSITKIEKEVAIGLARIFSTQIELSKLDRQEELLMNAQFKILQAQINPHFLFNALNTIAILIRVDPNKARELLLHLGNYYRNNLNVKSTDISIYEELKNVDSYLKIEKARYEDRLNVYYNIEEDVECFLPAFTIQPLVENAVKHGISKKIEGGKVVISVKRINCNLVRVIIEDSGVGMNVSTVKNLLDSNYNSKSIGIKNVNNRLIKKYGVQYKLIIKSRLNIGTKVILNIPN